MALGGGSTTGQCFDPDFDPAAGSDNLELEASAGTAIQNSHGWVREFQICGLESQPTDRTFQALKMGRVSLCIILGLPFAMREISRLRLHIYIYIS